VIAAAAAGALVLLVTLVGGLLLPADVRRGAALVLAVAALAGASSQSVPDSVRTATVVGVVVLLAGAAASPRSWSVPPPRATVATGVLFVVLVVLVLVEAPSTIVLMAELAAVGLLFSWTTATASPRDLVVLGRGLVVLGAGQALLGIVELTVLHRPVPWGYKSLGDGSVFMSSNKILPGDLTRVEGTLGHPIPYAVFLAVCLVVLLSRPCAFPAPVVVVVTGLLVTGLLVSGSRSVVAAVVVAVAYLLVTSHRSGRLVNVLVSTTASVVAVWLLVDEIADGISTLVSSGSWENRVGALGSVPGLLGRPPLEALLGSGFGSEPELYARGLLPQGGFTVIDNQLVSTLASFGVVGVLVLVAALVVGFARASRTGRAVLAVMVVMLFSFDWFVWFSMSALAFGAMAWAPRPEGAPGRPTRAAHAGPRHDFVRVGLTRAGSAAR
jgi:hypothetical protein